MSGTLYAAISGLNAEQALLGVISENIANVNTTGYKSSSMSFAQMMQQTLSGGTAPTATLGGTNPEQVSGGAAVGIGAVDVNMSQGSLQTTGIKTNMAISGHGFFVIKTPNGYAYSRSGDFTLDAQGQLVTPQGDFVMGWMAQNGQLTGESQGNISPITIQPNMNMAPSATTSVSVNGNLNAALATAASSTATTSGSTVRNVPVTVYDSLGDPVTLNVNFSNPTATANSGTSWTVTVTEPPSTTALGSGTVNFSNSGAITSGSTVSLSLQSTNGSATPQKVTLNLNGLTADAAATSLSGTAGGYPQGTLSNFTIGHNGVITGTFSNGQTQAIAQVSLANFNNTAGLLNVGNNLWQQSANSGTAKIGQPGSGGLGTISSGSLEESNVSLANQFVSMISAQQGYQANAKVISVAQALDTTLVNTIAP
ncbi:MAG: flagellar hook protein FlgE [Firmicutes bacterium]|uniref:Flagellar hook protein FlgE n=1 Tax=Sulfobacillus benefaciens TaxID=453960 RepID=A0A2T2X6K8_9FIRM|nr:flagellar hook protein FlgE [Bacillota bacterium]MCL5015695.1 flagellar hook protein FlgE [Bacillota bacterium]PSR30119.1 MAG: flagellar hook protein FlgE [Sulfobacillus benefaciens]